MPGMKWMMYLMPLFFLVFFNNYAAGLSYYYFLSLLITIIQTYAFRYIIKEEDVRKAMAEASKKPRKKSGFMARLEEMQRQQQAMLREQQKQQQRGARLVLHVDVCVYDVGGSHQKAEQGDVVSEIFCDERYVSAPGDNRVGSRKVQACAFPAHLQELQEPGEDACARTGHKGDQRQVSRRGKRNDPPAENHGSLFQSRSKSDVGMSADASADADSLRHVQLLPELHRASRTELPLGA